MNANEIVVVRGKDACEVWGQGANTIQVFTPYDGARVVCWTLTNTQGYWKTWQLQGLAVGVPLVAKWFEFGSAAITYSGGTWTNITVAGVKFFRHASYNPARTLIWTSDADYDYLLASGDGWATLGDITITATGAATVVRSTMDEHSNPNIWQHPSMWNVFDRRFVVIATNIKAGDTVRFTGEQSKDSRLAPLCAVRMQGGAAPHAADSFMPWPRFMRVPDTNFPTAEPFSIPTSMQVQLLASHASTGVTWAPNVAVTGYSGYIFTPQHSAPGRELFGTTPLTGAPQVTIVQYSDDYPQGVAFAPAVGSRTTTRGLGIVVEGTFSCQSIDRGIYRESHRITAQGYRVKAEVVLKDDTITLKQGCYLAMLPLAPSPGFLWAPGQGDPVAVPPNPSDDTKVGTWYGDELIAFGGTFGDAAVSFRPLAGVAGTSTRMMCMRRVATGVGDCKLYAPAFDTASYSGATGDRFTLTGGFACQVFPMDMTTPDGGKYRPPHSRRWGGR